MSKITKLKLYRKLNPEAIKEEFRGLNKRFEAICDYCGEVIYYSIGQIVLCHKACKKPLKKREQYRVWREEQKKKALEISRQKDEKNNSSEEKSHDSNQQTA